jgi:integrase/recombinase XerD
MGSHDAIAGREAPGAALVAAFADADPVTRLVLGWLAGKRSEHTRTAYARDLGIIPRRRAGQAPSWLTWCRTAGVHPVTEVTGLHVAVYARQLSAAELSPSSAARKLAAVAGWYAWLERRGHIPASPAAGIARPRRALARPATPGLTADQALSLVHAADTAPGAQCVRTAALVAVLLFTGARVAEVIGADVVQDAGQRPGRAVQPLPDQGGPVQDDRDDRAPPVGRVGVPLDEARRPGRPPVSSPWPRRRSTPRTPCGTSTCARRTSSTSPTTRTSRSPPTT